MINSTVKQVASLIEHDLQRRGLAVGDVYLTANEVGQEFSVHPLAASRAMRLLAKRGILTRRRGAGTFVGPKVRPPSDIQVRRIHLFVSPDRMRMGLPSGELLDGILESTGSGNVQFDLLPPTRQLSYVQEVIERGRADGSLSGCVLIACLREIQESVLSSGIPSVVFGSVYPSTNRLPSVDLEQSDLGYLLASYLLGHGLHHMALVTREMWLPGDNLYHDGICRALREADGTNGGLMIRTVPPFNVDLTVEVLSQLLTQENRPAGLICRGPMLAEAALRAADIVGLRVPDDLEVVFDHWGYHTDLGDLGLPHAYATMSFKEQSMLVGQMLRQLIEGEQPNPDHLTIPVRMTEEAANGRRSTITRVNGKDEEVARPVNRKRRKKRPMMALTEGKKR